MRNYTPYRPAKNPKKRTAGVFNTIKEQFLIAFKDKYSWVRVGVAVVLAILIGTAITSMIAPTQGEHDTLSARVEDGIAHLGSELSDIGGDIGSIAGTLNTLLDDMTETQMLVNNMTGTLSTHADNISTLEGRVTNVEGKLETVSTTPPEGWLTGNFGLYTLHAKATKTGNYTAIITLVYSPPSSVNATTQDGAIEAFHTSVNWSAANIKSYECVPAYNGNWGIARVSFNIGAFNLVANTEKTIAVPFGGLPKASFAYAKVYPVIEQ